MLNRDDPLFLTHLLRCQMMISSVASMGSSVPTTFLIKGFNSSILSLNQIQHWLEFKPIEERLTVLAAIAARLPADVLAETLATARGIGKAGVRGGVLSQIVPLLPDGERAVLLKELLETFYLMKFSDDQAMLLERLAPFLSGDMLVSAHAAAESIENKYYSVRAVVALAGSFPGTQQYRILQQAFHSAKLIGDPDNRSKALEILARAAPPPLLSDLVAVAKSQPDSNNKIRLLTTLASLVSDNEKDDLVSAINKIARVANNSYCVAYAKIALSRCCTDGARFDALKDALIAIKKNNGNYSYLDMIEDISENLPQKLLNDLLENVVGVRNGYLRMQALASIAKHLTADLRKVALVDGLEIKDRNQKGQVLTALAPFLPPDQLREAIRGMLSVGDEIQRVNALISLAETFVGDERTSALADALSTTRAVSSSRDRADLIVKLQPYLDEKQIDDALEIIRSIRVPSPRLSAMAAFARYLGPTDLNDVLVMLSASSSTSRDYNVGSVQELARYMSVNQREALQSLLGDEFKMTAKTSDGAREASDRSSTTGIEAEPGTRDTLLASSQFDQWRDRMFHRMGEESGAERRAFIRLDGLLARCDQLSAMELSEALSLARQLSRRMESRRKIESILGTVVARLAQYLSNEQLGEALSLVKGIIYSDELIPALRALEPYLQPNHIDDAFDIVNSISDPNEKVDGFAVIAPKLTPQYMSKFSLIARAARRDASVAVAVSRVAQYLPKADIGEVVEVAISLKDLQARDIALDALAKQIASQEDLIFVERIICSKAMRERSALMDIIPFLARHIKALRLPLIRKAISDVAAWFP
jgi:hypothetical protein